MSKYRFMCAGIVDYSNELDETGRYEITAKGNSKKELKTEIKRLQNNCKNPDSGWQSIKWGEPFKYKILNL